VYDIAIYIVQCTLASFDTTAGDELFYPHLVRIPRAAPTSFFMLYGGIVVYTTVNAMHHISTLVGRVLLQHPATD